MPREVHQTYTCDPDDPENPEKQKLVGYVIVTRESAWDDKTRARALALTEWEDSLCTCGCGLPREIAHRKQHFTVDSFVCYAGRATAGVRAADEEKHKDNQAWFYGRYYYAVPADSPPEDDDN